MAPTTFSSLIALVCAFASTVAPAAEAVRSDGSFTWSADNVASDLRNDTLDATGNVRVRQGDMSIEARSASAKDFRSDNSQWTFSEEVRIHTPQANLQANTASASFVNGLIRDARVEGSPAEFEQQDKPADRQVRGRAGVIEYDVAAGILRMQDAVWFTNGKDEFRGEVVIYNMRDERIQINPDGQSGRVRGVIRPNNGRWDAASPPSTTSASESGA